MHPCVGKSPSCYRESQERSPFSPQEKLLVKHCRFFFSTQFIPFSFPKDAFSPLISGKADSLHTSRSIALYLSYDKYLAFSKQVHHICPHSPPEINWILLKGMKVIVSPHSQHLCSLGCIPTTCGPAGLSLRVCHSIAITHISDGLKMDLEPYVLW